MTIKEENDWLKVREGGEISRRRMRRGERKGGRERRGGYFFFFVKAFSPGQTSAKTFTYICRNACESENEKAKRNLFQKHSFTVKFPTRRPVLLLHRN